VLDLRVYRTAFLPALMALFVAAFALADRPAPAPSPLPADTFSGDLAYGLRANPSPVSLLGLARDFPRRAPGSPADDALAERFAAALAAPDAGGGSSTFAVRRLFTRARTADGTTTVETVVGTRPGLSNHRVVVLAHRDALGGPALADLSATAALFELQRVLKTQVLNKTLVLVSTSGATTGFAGARAWASSPGGPVDGVIVLGDLAGTAVHKPWVVSWPAAPRPTPLWLERTVQAAVRAETKSGPGAPHALAQWIRRALPVTVSEQGQIGAEGLPAVMISASGERGPTAGEPVRKTHLQALGRAVLHAVDALDAAPAPRHAKTGIVTLRNVLPDWAVRLVVGTLLLPALLAGLDAFFRARRRRLAVAPALRWLSVAALPVLLIWVWVRLLGVAGVIAASDSPVLPRAFPLTGGDLAALGSALLVAALGGYGARVLAGRPAPAPDALAVTTGLVTCALAAVLWVPNPYAAALLLPAAHLWLLATGGWRARASAAAIVLGLALPVGAVASLSSALGLGPRDLAWASALATAGGHGVWTAVVLAIFVAALAGLVRVVLIRARIERAERRDGSVTTRGPLSYAGPGSLGGTQSALRR
jgi:hypothetical protein